MIINYKEILVSKSDFVLLPVPVGNNSHVTHF